MANKRTINLELLAKNSTKKAFKDVGDDAGRMGATLGKVGVGIGVAFAAGAAVLIRAGFEAVESLKRLEVIGAQTEAAIKSTGGAAGVTAEQVRALADSLERTTATESEAIQEGANLLLTFTNIRNGAGKNERVFDRATELMVDMGRAMGTDAAGSAVTLGKALNDPVAGIAALTRVGVQFTDEQKDLIASLAESGDMFGAQQVILNELETQFGGSGEAYAATLAGQIDTLNHNMGGLAESVMISLMPALQDFVAWGNSDMVPFLEDFAAWFVEEGIPAIRDIAGFVVEYKDELIILAGVIATVTAAQWLLNIAMAANPVGIIVAALVALGGWFVWLGNNFTTAQGWVLGAAENVIIALVDITKFMLGLADGFVNGIISMINAVMGPINAVREALGLGAIIVPAFRMDTSALDRLANNARDAATLRDRTGRSDSGTAGNARRGGSGTFMALGGIVLPTPGGTQATIGEAGQAEAVIPLTARNLSLMGGGGTTVVVNAPNFVGSKNDLARVVTRAVEDARRSGSISRGAAVA